MLDLARQGFTTEQIKRMLHAADGTQCVKFRCDVMQNGAKVKEIPVQGSVALNRFADIQRTANLTIYEEIDYLKMELKPYMLLRMEDQVVSSALYITPWSAWDALNLTMGEFDALDITGADLDRGFVGSIDRQPQWVEFPLGVFIPSTPTVNSEKGSKSYSISCYDRTVILKEDAVTDRYFIPAGELVMDAVLKVMASAGVLNPLVYDMVGTKFTADREFEIGTSKLTIVNQLLDEINFNPIRCDQNGKFVISRYQEPGIKKVGYTYAADQYSIIERDIKTELDLYKVPNIFVAVCDNPDLDTTYRAVWVNDNPASKLSTVQRGRSIVSELYRPESIEDQAALDAYIRRYAWEANQVYEQIEFVTGAMPIHESGDVIQLAHPDANAVYVESSWELKLEAGGAMTHHARRLVQV